VDRNNERVIEKPQGSRRTDEPLAGPPANEVTLQFLRACTGLIVGFQALFLVAHAWLLGPNFTRELLALHLFNVAGGCLGFLATYSRFIHRHWRRVAMAVAGAVVIGAALIAAVAHEREILTYELTLFLTGTGAFLPWEPVWQLVFNVVALAAYAPVAGMRGDPAVIVGWLTVLTSAAIGSIAVALNTRNRHRGAQVVEKLEEEGAQREANIAQLEHIHKQLAQSETELRRVFEASQDTICINSLINGRYIDISKDTLLSRDGGYKREEALGSNNRALRIWAHDEQRERFSAQLRANGVVSNFEADFRLKDGSLLPCIISGSVVTIEDEPCVITVTSDVSRLKQTEHKLIEAREEALAASRAKSEFLSSMSHEIRTPMNAILGMADVLGETRLGKEQRQYLDIMSSNGNALLHLINDILDLAKVESGRLHLDESEFRLDELLQGMAETLRLRAHEKGLELAVRILPEVPLRLVGDQLRLRQVLINLVGNAIKFTQHGEVALSVESDPESPAPGGLRFSVHDTGIGIPPQNLEKIFDSFTQADSSTSRKYGGSGLGLAIGKRLVELMGGRLWAESQPGAGSTFVFTARFGVQPAQSQPEIAPALKLEGVRALVVDDNATNRLIVKEMLARRGASVAEADSGESALRESRRAGIAGQPYQLVLLDCRMPRMDGFEVAQRLRTQAHGPEPIILMLTSDDLHHKLRRIRQLGLKTYLVKPVTSAELYRAIAIAMGSADALKPKPDEQLQPAEPPATERPLSILLAEDSADNRLLIKQYLKRLPYRLETAPDGEVALEKFVSGNYDLVLMDIQMPVMDGYTAVGKIRNWEREQSRPPTPIVALTASALEGDVRNCLAAGCNAHLSKPLKKATLLSAIREATGAAANGAGSDEQAEARPAQLTRITPDSA